LPPDDKKNEKKLNPGAVREYIEGMTGGKEYRLTKRKKSDDPRTNKKAEGSKKETGP